MKFAMLAMIAALVAQDPGVADEARALMEENRQEEAFALVSEGAQQGDAGAIEYLGWFYDTGTFVKRDLSRAVQYFELAAELGQPHAQWRLGVLMDTGECACGSPEEAVMLFRQAADQGWTNAMVSLGVMHSSGRGTERNLAAARASFEAGARAGNSHGLTEIGVMYFNGEGVVASPQDAAPWFLLAMVNGNERAEEILSTQYSEFDLDMAKAVDQANVIAEDYGYESNLIFEE